MRTCFKCGLAKDPEFFWSTCAYCKSCDAIYRKEYRLKYKEHRKQNRMRLWREKKSRSCKKCLQPFVGKGRSRDYCSTKCKLLGCIVKRKNGCWEWKGKIHPNGYACTTNHETNKREHVHRISFRLFKGEIPENLYVCHACDNRKCIAPDHLFLGTAKENMLDAKEKGRMEHVKLKAAKGIDNPNAKLDEKQVKDIREDIKAGIRCTVIARKYSVSPTVIYGIRDRRAWKHI